MWFTGDLHAAALEQRAATLRDLSRGDFDILVVGGGITGAAVAREAAASGLSVALIEQDDYASGTSSRSSRLIHGGLRYVKQMRVGLVAASLEEQATLAASAPHLVRPLPFLLPMYSAGRPSPAAMRLGMGLYRALSPSASASEHKSLSAGETAAQEPLLASGGLAGGFLHREYVTHDARLVIETILAARDRGAVTANYVRRQGVLTQGGCAVGVLARDTVSGDEFEIRARVVVNATGPWAPPVAGWRNGAPAMALSKGVHAVLPRRRLPIRQAVAFFSPQDGRPLFAVPQDGIVYLGTTETPYEGDPARVAVEGADIEYLAEAAAQAFPGRQIRAADVVASWAGVRPLVSANWRDADRLSRRYVLRWNSEGVLSILGGKLTLHRRVARAAMATMARRHGWPVRGADPEAESRLPGAVWPTPPLEVAAGLARGGLGADAARHLMDTYGGRARHFAPILDQCPTWGHAISPGAPHIWAELAFAVHHEMVVRPDDFTRRRTDLGLLMAAEGVAAPSSLHTWEPPAALAPMLAAPRRDPSPMHRSAT
jgi:glycerol-3-phosphate dehydrogenase